MIRMDAMSDKDPNDGGEDLEELIEPAEKPDSVVVDWDAKISPTPAADTPAVPPPVPDDEPPIAETPTEPEIPVDELTPAPQPIDEDDEETLRRSRPTPSMVIAVASGKGGVGKSLMAASLGIYLAQLGKEVILVDAALGSPNLHTLVGANETGPTLHDFLRKEGASLEDSLCETPFPSLRLIPGHQNGYAAANPRPTQKNLLLSKIRNLPADVVVIDLDPGTSFNVLDLFLVADLHLVLTLPEPTSIESSFRLIKSAFIRKAAGLPGMKALIEELRPGAYAGLPTPNQMRALAMQRNPAMAEAIHHVMASFKPRLVVNKVRTRDDLKLGPALTVAGRRHVGLPLDYLGPVENDDLAWVTVRKRRPLMVEYPDAKVCKDLERVVRRVIQLETKERPECMRVPKPLAQQNHYEILGLHPGATEEEVRRAQRRVRAVYAHDSTAVLGIAPPEEVEQLHRRIEDAYATLVDPEKRHLYNKATFPGVKDITQQVSEGSAAASAVSEGIIAPANPPPLEDLPDMPALDDDTEYTGDLIRQVREARGLEVDDLCNRTKISLAYLRAMEEEDFHAMPAPVYLRGFIKAVARELRLDVARVAETYMARFEANQD